MAGILVSFHCESNPGFAAAKHELTFFKMAIRLVGTANDVHFAYRTLEKGRSPTLPPELTNIIEFDTAVCSRKYLTTIESYVRGNNIQTVFGFDMPVKRLAYNYLRRGGVCHIVSYWGAPMSSPNRGIKMLLKKIDVMLAPSGPDAYIFQSEGMCVSATHGRGINPAKTYIVRTGIDTDRYCPSTQPSWYAHHTLGIPHERKIVFFSGHMEPRKGVDVIIKTAAYLVNTLHRTDLHFVLLGNRNNEETQYFPIYKGTLVDSHITFGGYRNDVPDLLKSCVIGFIASTGWDSFPMSSIEMASSGLPLIISDLPGLQEVVTTATGFLYPVGDFKKAAEHIIYLLENEPIRKKMGEAGRARVLEKFSVGRQVEGIENVVRKVAGIADGPKSYRQP